MREKNGDNEHGLDGNSQDPTYSLTFKDVVDILEIIECATCRELEIQLGDLRMTVIKRGDE